MHRSSCTTQMHPAPHTEQACKAAYRFMLGEHFTMHERTVVMLMSRPHGQGRGCGHPAGWRLPPAAVAARLCLPCLALVTRQAVHGDAQDGSLGGGRGVDEVESQGAQARHRAVLRGRAAQEVREGRWGTGCARAVGVSGCKGGQRVEHLARVAYS